MQSRHFIAAILGLVALTIGVPAQPAYAHHCFKDVFDANAPIAIKGKILAVEWVNPHALIHVSGAVAGEPVQRLAVLGGHAQCVAAPGAQPPHAAGRNRGHDPRLQGKGHNLRGEPGNECAGLQGGWPRTHTCGWQQRPYRLRRRWRSRWRAVHVEKHRNQPQLTAAKFVELEPGLAAPHLGSGFP